MSKSSKWPLGIAVFFGAFVLFFVVIFVFSKFNRVSLVEDDYYQQELQYQKQINRVENARSLSVPVRIRYSRNLQRMEFQFPKHGAAAAITGRIEFFRPSDASLDHAVAITLNPEFKQAIPTSKLATGLWRLKINWTQENREFYFEDTIVVN